MNRAVVFAGGAVDEAKIFAPCGFGSNLRLEMLMGEVGFGDNDRASGVFIETMNDAGALGSTNAGKLTLAMV
jgi:hypothetical protein